MGLDAIGIVSKNISKSVQFYSLLGVELKEVGGQDHFEGTTDSGVRIMLDSLKLTKKINPNWIEPSGSGVVLCFKQRTSEEVNALFLKIVEAGFHAVRSPWDAFWGQRYSSVKDPDGNQIDILAPL